MELLMEVVDILPSSEQIATSLSPLKTSNPPHTSMASHVFFARNKPFWQLLEKATGNILGSLFHYIWQKHNDLT